MNVLTGDGLSTNVRRHVIGVKVLKTHNITRNKVLDVLLFYQQEFTAFEFTATIIYLYS